MNQDCSVAGARYNMTADIYELIEGAETQDAYGEIVRTNDSWTFNRNVLCIARAAKGSGVRFTPSRETFAEDHMDYEYVMLYTKQLVTKRSRVTNIKDSNGNIAWVDEDGTPTMFNVNGHIPQFNPFGGVQEYLIVLERVDAS